MSRKKPDIKHRIEAHIEERVVPFAIAHPAFEQTRASYELKKEGMFIPPCGVRCVWLRHDLETFQKRFEAFRLTDEQIYQRLSETEEMGYSIDYIVSRFETGIYILSKDYIKSRYEYILKYGWWTILTNPFMLVYVLWIIGIVRLRSLRKLKEE